MKSRAFPLALIDRFVFCGARMRRLAVVLGFKLKSTSAGPWRNRNQSHKQSQRVVNQKTEVSQAEAQNRTHLQKECLPVRCSIIINSCSLSMIAACNQRVAWLSFKEVLAGLDAIRSSRPEGDHSFNVDKPDRLLLAWTKGQKGFSERARRLTK